MIGSSKGEDIKIAFNILATEHNYENYFYN